MIGLRLPVIMLTVLIAFPALAQETAPGRYTMRPTDEGMLRLDTKTGEVSLCSNTTGTWACRSVPDDRIALENEIDRLNAENRKLRVEPGNPGGEGGGLRDKAGREEDGPGWRLPNDQEIAEFKSFLGKMMRQFRSLLEPPHEDMPEKKL